MSIKKVYKHLFPEKFRIEARLLVEHITHPYYLGNRYSCNCCNRSFRKFHDKGNIPRKNAQCPNCGSLERTRLLLFYLKNETEIFTRSGCTILHIAPERPLFNLLKKTDAIYIDGDINPAYARQVVDVTGLQYPDNYFDYIICSHVLGHVPDEAQAIRELTRVLRWEGTALILTLLDLQNPDTLEHDGPLTAKERMLLYGEPDLFRRHGEDFAGRLAQSGLRVERIDYRKKLSVEINQQYRLGNGEREVIFKCTKREGRQ
jgi:SAM-dependent methyltransferase